MDKYLIDTQILLWHSEDPTKISDEANKIINSNVELYISIASLWEIAIKAKTGKLILSYDRSILEYFTTAINRINAMILEITMDNIAATMDLELIHRDPFDRIILATAVQNNFNLISSDKIFDEYNLKRIW